MAEEEQSVHDAEMQFVRGGTLKRNQKPAAAAALKAKKSVVHSIDIRALEELEVRSTNSYGQFVRILEMLSLRESSMVFL